MTWTDQEIKVRKAIRIISIIYGVAMNPNHFNSWQTLRNYKVRLLTPSSRSLRAELQRAGSRRKFFIKVLKELLLNSKYNRQQNYNCSSKPVQQIHISMNNPGATVVINHHIIDGKQDQYENWLNEIGPVCRSYVGHIDWQIIRPIPNLTFDYTVIIRFDTIENLTKWMESNERKVLIEKAQPLFSKDDQYHIKSGLDFLFSNNDEKQKVPARWKQYLVTWSAIYPLSIIIPLLVLPLLELLNFPQNRFINSFFISGVVVFIMVYFLMPNYTRFIRKWLYN